MRIPKAAGLPERAAIRKFKAPQPPKQVESWLDALMAMNMAMPAMATVSAAATMVTATNTTMTTVTTSDYDWSARHDSHGFCPM